MPSDPNKGNPPPPSAQNKRLQQTQAQVDEVSRWFLIHFFFSIDLLEFFNAL